MEKEKKKFSASFSSSFGLVDDWQFSIIDIVELDLWVDTDNFIEIIQIYENIWYLYMFVSDLYLYRFVLHMRQKIRYT